MAADKTVNCTQNQHSYRVCYWICQETENAGPPVVDNVLGQFPVYVIAEEAAHHREPEHEKVYYVVEGIECLIFGIETETPRYLTEKQEKEILQIPVEEHWCQENQTAKGSK